VDILPETAATMPTVSFGMNKPPIKICAESNKKASTFGFYYFQKEGILSSSFSIPY